MGERWRSPMKLLYLVAVYVHIVTFAVWFGAMLFEDPPALGSCLESHIRFVGLAVQVF